MAYYGSQDSMAMYYRNMGLEPDGTTPLAPAPSPVPTPMPAAGAAGPAFQPQLQGNMNYAEQMAGALQGGDSYQAAAGMVGAATGVPRPDFGGEMQSRPAGRIQERQMYGDRDRYTQERQMYGDRDRYDPQAVQNPAFMQQDDIQTYGKQQNLASVQPQKSWAPATFPGQGAGGPSSSMQPLPQAVDQQSRAYRAMDQQNLASVQPSSAPPQSQQRPSPQPFRPMGPRQSPERGPMSASSTMGGNPQNTRPRQPNPAMPPPGQPMRGPRRSTPMGS